MPQNSLEFEKIFDRKPSSVELSRIGKEFTLDEHFGEQRLLATSDSNIETFKQFLNGNDALLVTIVGHNENGKFRLPSGRTISILEMSNACSEAMRRCVFLSCNAETYLDAGDQLNIGVSSRLSYPDAERLIERIHNRLSKLDIYTKPWSYFPSSAATHELFTELELSLNAHPGIMLFELVKDGAPAVGVFIVAPGTALILIEDKP